MFRTLARQMIQPVGAAGLAALLALSCASLARAGCFEDYNISWMGWLGDLSMVWVVAGAFALAEIAARAFRPTHPIRRLNESTSPRLTPTGNIAFRLIWYCVTFLWIAQDLAYVWSATDAIREPTRVVADSCESTLERANGAHGALRDPLLALAVRRHDAAEVRMLLRRGANPNTLLSAANRIRSGIVAGSDANITVLDEALRDHDRSTADLLTQFGAQRKKR